MQYKQQLLNRIKSGQKSISKFEQDLLDRHQHQRQHTGQQQNQINESNPMLKYAASGGVNFVHSGSMPSLGSTNQRNDVRIHGQTTEETNRGVQNNHNILSIPSQTLAREVIVAHSLPASGLASSRSNQLQSFQSRAPGPMGYRRNTLNHDTADSRIQIQSRSPNSRGSRQYRRVASSNSKYSMNSRGSYSRTAGPSNNGDTLERHVTNSVPLRRPSSVKSPPLGTSPYTSRGNSLTPNSPMLSGRSATQNFGMSQTGEKGNPFTTQDERHIVPIAEESTNREISSIHQNMVSIENQANKGPHQSYPTVTDVHNINIQQHQHQSVQDDSQQYIFTSVANSIEDPEGYEILEHNEYTPAQEDNKFVFNTNALENEPPIQQDDLSEPAVMSHIKQKQQRVITDQIQKLVRHDQKRHHAGGSFGNLQQMLEPHSYKVNGEATTGQTSAFASNQANTVDDREAAQAQPSSLRFKYHSKTEKPISHKVRIICSDSSEETLDPDMPAPHTLQAQAEYMDSSQEFRDRKYQIRQQNTDLQEKSRKQKKLVQNQEQDRKESTGGRKSQKKLRKSQSHRSHHKISQNSVSDGKLSSSSDSRVNQNNSQLSLHDTEKQTYGKYFARSRSRQKSLKRSKSNRAKRRVGSESLTRSKRRQGPNKSTLTIRSSVSLERRGMNKSFRSGKSAKSYTSRKGSKKSKSQKSKRGNSKRRTSTSRGCVPHGTVPSTITTHQRTSSNRPPKTLRQNLNTIQPTSGAVQRPPRQYSTIDTWNNKAHTYRGAKRQNTSKTQQKDTTVILDPNGPDATLAQRLLIDLAKKYKNMEKGTDMKHHFLGHGSGVAAKNAQQTQMIQEIQSLATALIQSDKTITKIHREKTNTQKRLKNIISEQEECMALMQEKIDRLENKYCKTQKSLDRVENKKRHEEVKNKNENKEMSKIVDELRDKIQKNKEKHYGEKKELVSDMEKEFTIQFTKMSKKHEIKLNTLKSINDQLNVKLSEYKRAQPEYNQLQQDYQESLNLLQELQQQLHNQQLAQDHLVKENQELASDLKKNNRRSEDKILELAKKVEKVQTKSQEQINQLKKEHQCDMKKWQISKGQEEDTQKFQYEEKITQLRMTLQSREDKVDELSGVIKEYEDQIYNEKHESQAREQQILIQVNESEEQRQRLDMEAKDLEQQVSHMQKVVQWKDELIEDLEKRALGQGRGDKQSQATIRMLEEQLAQSQDRERQSQEKMQQLRQDHAFQVQNLQDKMQLQQQEIHILAQGFQAQQQKLQQHNTNTAHFSGIGSVDTETKGSSDKILVQNQAAQIVSPTSYQLTTLTEKSEITGYHNTNRSRQAYNIQANSSAPMGTHYNTDLSTMREHRQNESGAGPIAVEQNSYISRVSNDNDSYEESEANIQTKNVELEDAYQINQARIQSQIHLGPTSGSQPGTFTNSVKEDFSSNQDQLLNTCSLSSTDRQFENYKATRRLDNHTFGGNNNLLQSKESDCLKEGNMMADQLNQRDQEIKILWNVINQMKTGSAPKKDEPVLTQSSFAEQPALLDTKNNQLKISHGPMSSGHLGSNYLQKAASGNQSSLMQINGAYQFAPGEAADSLSHLMHPQSTYGTEAKEEYKSPPLLDSINTQGSLNSINKQELIDVKKRIQRLMGEKNGPADAMKQQRKVDESTGSENNTLQTGANASNIQSNGDNNSQRISQYAFNSKNECDSESIEQFHFKNQRA